MRVSKGRPIGASAADKVLEEGRNYSDPNWYVRTTRESNGGVALGSLAFLMCRTSFPQVAVISGSFFELAARCFARPTHTLPRSLSSLDEPVLHRHDGLCKQFQDNLGG